MIYIRYKNIMANIMALNASSMYHIMSPDKHWDDVNEFEFRPVTAFVINMDHVRDAMNENVK